MSKRYIDAQELALKWMFASPKQREIFRQVIDETPTADVVEVRHGEWVGLWDFECSICNEYSEHRTSYCPNCGAKMEIERIEENEG